ncbi:MAG: phosphoglucomutase/phosphomannomutase family protein [Elusimicrobia bacterium]|nr:phosphoglucomutase/phosphomannomutase family protein [Elusimicrobiota bacterium]MDE2236313.1 phosphoglucomutase/phosphomannomutase family protein [Elusimicrobiota bacterium]MDE2424659.1 phosphoglucomutase/phosphomannomutase family protein [Elusimicrobiota bacterium]
MIRFGTAGWRATIADEFTFQNVRKVAHAIGAYVKENAEYGVASEEYRHCLEGKQPPPVPTVVVGYDTRFLSDEFAHEIAQVFASDGIKTLISEADLPTPVVAWAIRARGAIGGVMLTASHNPGQYNGFKWMPCWGGAAVPAITDDLERRIELLGQHSVKIMPLDRSLRESWISEVDFKPGYFKHLCSLLDVKAIRKAKLRVGVDAMHGSARRYLRPLLESLGVEVVALHEDRDVLFGGVQPEPSEERLKELAALMVKRKLDLGLACDGDADRFGVLDAGANWIACNEVLALAVEHLVVHRGLRGKIARSVMTSHFVDAVAKSHGLDTRETPVGFKYIGELLRTGQYLLGGEESGGLSIMGHVPDKDGLLACLLMVELAAVEGKPLASVRDRLFKKVGAFHNVRLNYHLDRMRDLVALQERLRVKPPLDLAGGSVWRIDESDGFKFILRDGSWLGLRPSGTEPAFRVYAEAHTDKHLDALVVAGKKLLQGKL